MITVRSDTFRKEEVVAQPPLQTLSLFFLLLLFVVASHVMLRLTKIYSRIYCFNLKNVGARVHSGQGRVCSDEGSS